MRFTFMVLAFRLRGCTICDVKEASGERANCVPFSVLSKKASIQKVRFITFQTSPFQIIK